MRETRGIASHIAELTPATIFCNSILVMVERYLARASGSNTSTLLIKQGRAVIMAAHRLLVNPAMYIHLIYLRQMCLRYMALQVAHTRERLNPKDAVSPCLLLMKAEEVQGTCRMPVHRASV